MSSASLQKNHIPQFSFTNTALSLGYLSGRTFGRSLLSRALFWAGSSQTVSSRIALVYVGRCKDTMASLVQSWPNRDDCSPQTIICLERETEAGAGSGPEQMSSHGSQRKGSCASQAGRSPRGCWGGQTMPEWTVLWVH